MLLTILTSPGSHSQYLSVAKSIISNRKEGFLVVLEQLMDEFSVSWSAIIEYSQSKQIFGADSNNLETLKPNGADRLNMGETEEQNFIFNLSGWLSDGTLPSMSA